MAIVGKSFKRVVTSAGTPVALSAAKLLTPSFTVHAWKSNTGDVWIADSNVADPEAASDGADCGEWLVPGAVISRTARTTKHGIKKHWDLSKVYIDAANTNDWVVVTYDDEEE